MRFELAPTTTRTPKAPNVSAALIGDWASRVMDLWEESRDESCASQTAAKRIDANQELGDACRVRDELNNQLERTHQDEGECAERALEILRSADDLFRQFTIQATTAASLSSHNHYARRGEWWWSRLPRPRIDAA